MWRSLSRIVDNNNVYSSTLAKVKQSHVVQVKASKNTRSCGSNSTYWDRNVFAVRSSLRCGSLFQQQQQRYFRNSSRKNGLPQLMAMVLAHAARMGAAAGGRFARRWWQNLPPEQRATYTKKVARYWYIIAGMFGATGFGSFVYYQSHIQETPVTKRKRFIAFTPEHIQELANLTRKNLLEDKENHFITAEMGTAEYRKIMQVAEKLLNGNQDLPQIRELEWSVKVIDDKYKINAFVLPCGSIFVYSGLLQFCENDDQLGIILAHEMAHAVMQHSAEAMSLRHFMDLLLIIPLVALWALIPNDIGAKSVSWIMTNLNTLLVDLPHSRFMEEEADKVGMELAAKACFDIREAPVVWVKMGMISEGDPQIEWTSTHPSNEKRQDELDKMIPDMVSVREKCQCPTLSILDPRLKIDKMKQKSEQ